jgi:hypothetical protein
MRNVIVPPDTAGDTTRSATVGAACCATQRAALHNNKVAVFMARPSYLELPSLL